MVTCFWCVRDDNERTEYLKIDNRHFKSSHDSTKEEYMKEFPEAKCWSDEMRKITSDSTKEAMETKHWARTFTEEQIKELSDKIVKTRYEHFPNYFRDDFISYTQSVSGEEKELFYQDIAKKAKETRIENGTWSLTGSMNGMFGKSVYEHWVDIHGIEEANRLAEIRHDKISASVSGSKNAWFGTSVKEIWTEKHGPEIAEEMWKKKYEDMSERISGSGNPMYGINV